MKYILFLSAFLFSCSNHSTETIVKKYMVDSVVPTFNDPSSYQFVSMTVDTFKGRDYIKNIRDLYKDTILFTKDLIKEKQTQAESLESRKGYLDSIIDLEVTVNFRGKNKFGALILNKADLRYHPQDGKMELVSN